MEGLTKEEAIKRHRQLWNYIADESERQGRIITKAEAFIYFGWPRYVRSFCWCCEYDKKFIDESYSNQCLNCPIKWPNERCKSDESPFSHYINAKNDNDYRFYCHKENVEKAVKAARDIANLPENPNV